MKNKDNKSAFLPQLDLKEINGLTLLSFSSLLKLASFLLFPRSKKEQKQALLFFAGKILYDCPEFISNSIFSQHGITLKPTTTFEEATQEVAPELFEELNNLIRENGGQRALTKSLAKLGESDILLRLAAEGIAAGKILELMLKQKEHHNFSSPSVHKSIHIIESTSKEGLIDNFWDISKFPFNRNSIRMSWESFKPVSPYWAAVIAFFSWEKYQKPGNIHFSIYPTYFSLVRQFILFGESYFSHGQNSPILNPALTYSLPESFPIIPQSINIPPLNEKELKALKIYRAPKSP